MSVHRAELAGGAVGPQEVPTPRLQGARNQAQSLSWLLLWAGWPGPGGGGPLPSYREGSRLRGRNSSPHTQPGGAGRDPQSKKETWRLGGGRGETLNFSEVLQVLPDPRQGAEGGGVPQVGVVPSQPADLQLREQQQTVHQEPEEEHEVKHVRRHQLPQRLGRGAQARGQHRLPRVLGLPG